MELLTKDRIKLAAATLAEAFYTDPFFTFIQPRDEARKQWLASFMGAALLMISPAREVYGEEDGAAGVLGLLPPGQQGLSLGRLLAFARGTLPATISLRVPPRSIYHGLRVALEMERLHPKELHWYVQIFGVHPDRQRRGVGRRMFSEILARIDREELPAYLETTKESNLIFYRQFGFEVRQEFVIAEGVPPVWTMRRPANDRTKK